MQQQRYPTVEDSFGHWLAGLIAGEGCFNLGRQATGQWRINMQLGLRFDDRPTLEYVQRETGLGRLYDHKASTPTSCPYSVWSVFGKSQLAQLILILDRFPIRAKKARDYQIWREACCHWIAGFSQGRPGDHGPLEAAKARLASVRAYDALFEPRDPPLAESSLALF